jgi:hypothetical protein
MGYEKLNSSDFASNTIDLEYDTGSGFVSFGGGDTTIPGPGGTGVTDAVIFSYDLSAVSALDDAASVTLRWNIPDITQTTGEGNPNLRFDNWQVYGAVIPEPSATALLLGAGFLFLAFRRRRG